MVKWMGKSKGISGTHAFIIVAVAMFVAVALIVSLSIGGEAPPPPVSNVTVTPTKFQPAHFKS